MLVVIGIVVICLGIQIVFSYRSYRMEKERTELYIEASKKEIEVFEQLKSKIETFMIDRSGSNKGVIN